MYKLTNTEKITKLAWKRFGADGIAYTFVELGDQYACFVETASGLVSVNTKAAMREFGVDTTEANSYTLLKKFLHGDDETPQVNHHKGDEKPTIQAEKMILDLVKRVKRPITLKEDIKPLFANTDLPAGFAIWNLIKKGDLRQVGRGRYER